MPSKDDSCNWTVSAECTLLDVLEDNQDQCTGTGYRASVFEIAVKVINAKHVEDGGVVKTASKVCNRYSKVSLLNPDVLVAHTRRTFSSVTKSDLFIAQG